MVRLCARLSAPTILGTVAFLACTSSDPSSPGQMPSGQTSTGSSTSTITTGPYGGAGGALSQDASAAGGSTSGGRAGTAGSAGSGNTGGSIGEIIDAAGPYVNFCDLPGSVRFTSNGIQTVAGGVGAGSFAFLHLPQGFCAHYFGNIGNVRQLRFAPNGDLFVASPTKSTTGGGLNGLAAVVILPDDDRDGVADNTITFLSSLPATQGILFANGHFYYQDDYRLLRLPYQPGDRAPSAPGQQIADTHQTATTGYYTSFLHWTKTLDQADDGTIYVANGSDQDEVCDVARPFRGGIFKLDGSPAGRPVSKGFRNPAAVRCSRGHNVCFAAELSKDYSANDGGREKLVPIRDGDDWGFPCCATKNVPHTDIAERPDCGGVTPDDVSFFIGDTPFGFDFERGKWNTPHSGAVFVALHGAAGTWTGARVVVIATDPGTGMPKPGSNVPGTSTGAMADFATGWDDGSRANGRPAAIEFAPDGRMFIGNDNNGDIFWVAPADLPR
jgi:glucose/arabinose dehydrogenase